MPFHVYVKALHGVLVQRHEKRHGVIHGALDSPHRPLDEPVALMGRHPALNPKEVLAPEEGLLVAIVGQEVDLNNN